jgi:hypothetical protein
MEVVVSTVSQPPWGLFRTCQRMYQQPRRIDGKRCGNHPFNFLRPRLYVASLQRIPSRAGQVGCR